MDDAVPLPPGTRRVDETRIWQAGESIALTLDMPVRITEPDRRIDAVRGCVALERGPLVYCLETADLPPGVTIEDVELDAATRPVPVPRPDLADGVIGLAVPATRGNGSPVDVGAIPYFAWANRSVDAMRVWIPRGVPGSPGLADGAFDKAD